MTHTSKDAAPVSRETATTPRSVWTLPATVIATGLGSGYAPFAPGTAGSAVGLALWWPITMLPLWAQAALVLVVSLVGIAAGGHVARHVGLEDPGIVVIDEVCGMWLTLLALPLTPWTAAIGFLLFRVLDVVKPFPARRFETFHGGWGIMADDLMVGIYGNLAIRGGLLLWTKG